MDAERNDERTRNAVLAGLRMLQAWKEDRVRSVDPEHDVDIDMIETDGGSADPMTADEIEELCESVNTGGIRLVAADAA